MSDSAESRVLQRLPLLLMLVLTASCLWSRPLLPIDETRYLAVAWEMWTSGDWLVAHLNGLTYAHKPPLLFWLINTLWLLTGPAELAARLVAPAAALLSVLLTGCLARLLWPDQTPAARDTQRCAPLVQCSLMLWLLFSPLTMFDALLTVSVQLALSGVLQLHRQRTASGLLLLTLGLGMGILTKGPVVCVHALPAALLAPWWSAAARQAPLRWLLHCGLALAGAAALALAWALPSAAQGGPAYANELLWGQTAGRMVHSFAHREPWWWYLPVLPLCALPWPLLSRFRTGLRTLPADAGSRFLCVSLLLPLLILSAVSGKQVYYLLPLSPALALLIARSLVTHPPTVSQTVSLIAIRPIALGTMLCGAIPAVVWLLPDIAQGRLSGVCPAWYSLPLTACGAVLLLVRTTDIVRVVRAISAAAVVFISLLVIGLGSTFWPGFDTRPLAEHVRALQDRDIPVAWFGNYHGQLHYVGRLRTPLAELYTPAELQAWLQRHPGGRVIMRQVSPPDAAGLPELPLEDASATPPVVSGAESAQRWTWRGGKLAAEYHADLRTGLNTARWLMLRYCSSPAPGAHE